MSRIGLRLIVILAAVACYVASLYLPAISYVPLLRPNPYWTHAANVPGWFPLAFGWFAMLFMQLTAFTYLANPIFYASIVTFGIGKNVMSALLAATSIVLGLSFFALSSKHPVPLIFSAHGEALNRPKPMEGFYLWIAAFVIMLLGSTVNLLIKKYVGSKP